MFVIIEHGSRHIVHSAVTRSPTSAWAAQQLREATVWSTGPRFLIRDNDDKFDTEFDRVAEGAGTRVLRTPNRAPRANSICERLLVSLRRECLDHVLILGEEHLNRLVREYATDYFNSARPHQGIGQRIPIPAQQPPPTRAARRSSAPRRPPSRLPDDRLSPDEESSQDNGNAARFRGVV